MHVFTFELWPATKAHGSYPIQLPDRTPKIEAASAKAARMQAQAIASERGLVVGAGSHHRGQCSPPHVGTEFGVGRGARSHGQHDSAANAENWM